MALLCPPPLWQSGHISKCIEDRYLLTLIPITACVVSACTLVCASLRLQQSFRPPQFDFAPLTTIEGQAINQVDSLDAASVLNYVTVIPLRILRFEALAVSIDFLIGIGLLFQGGEGWNSWPQSVSIFFSLYLLVLLLTRLRLPALYTSARSSAAVLYAVQWTCTLLITHAVLTDHIDRKIRITICVRLALYTLLCLFHALASRTPAPSLQHSNQPSITARDEEANLVSRLLFSWLDELVWLAYRVTLDETNLYGLNPRLECAAVAAQFDRRAKPTLPLSYRLFSFVKIDLLKQGAWAALTGVAVYLPPVFVRLILRYLEPEKEVEAGTAWACAVGILLSGLLSGIADAQNHWIGFQIGARLRAVLTDALFAKILRRRIAVQTVLGTTISSHSAGVNGREAYASDGYIINLVSSDVESVCNIAGNLYLVWLTFPIQTGLGILFLYQILGASGILGVLIMVILLPLNVLLSKRMTNVQERVMEASDSRIQASNEVINNIRTIKYCAWEMPFGRRVLNKRGSEMKLLGTYFFWWSISMTVFHSLPYLVTILTCFFYSIVWGHELRASIAFPALAIFAILRIPLDRLADTITFILQGRVSLERIDDFLQERETAKYKQLLMAENLFDELGFIDATLVWPAALYPIDTEVEDNEGGILLSEQPTSLSSFSLQGLQVRFKKDSLNCIYGPSGSGKSSLLLALLGEMDLISGKILLPHDNENFGFQPGQRLLRQTAYCAQEPWIMNRTVRANILCGLPFSSRRYEEVLNAVALRKDMDSLDQGDQTLAGENGSRLSGGQKARVALARALYSNCSYLLLDDCLSALDSRTAKYVFSKAFKGELMHGRTCILATHQVQLALAYSDFGVILQAGKIIGQGNPAELAALGLVDIKTPVAKSGFTDLELESPHHRSLSPKPDYVGSLHKSLEEEASNSDENEFNESVGLDIDRSAYQESKSEGAVPWRIIRTYFQAMGSGWYWSAVFLGFITQQLIALGSNLWMKEWAFQYDNIDKSLPQQDWNAQSKVVPAAYYLMVYTMICLAYAVVTLLRDLITFKGSLKASLLLYQRILDCLLHAKLFFFDQVPLGQITNRLSADVVVVDQQLSSFLVSMVQIAASVLTVIGLISVYLPMFLLVVAFISLAYYMVMGIYINGARDLKRIQAVRESPLYQQVSETLSGCVSIRSSAQISIFTTQTRKLVDQVNQPSLLVNAAQEWLTLRVNALSSIISFFAGAFVLWKSNSLSAGAAGLVLTYCASFSENVIWLVQLYAIIQQKLNSVERLVEYTEIEQEAKRPVKTHPRSIHSDWPSHGAIRFQMYTTRYAPELEPALVDIDFNVRPGERMAIVGRTGSGKSTLTLALIRALEADRGCIEIDGVDIASLKLEHLRQVVTVIPQDPHVFDGSLRENLDPLQQHTDIQILEILRTVHLDPSCNSQMLNCAAIELSRGQRQLLCIARALLRQSRILVLDEATASIDHITDSAIQTTLRATVASGTTILTIAHRLQTIADYDSVIVLDSGRVVERGSVSELLKRRGKDARFRSLCEESGDLATIEMAAGF